MHETFWHPPHTCTHSAPCRISESIVVSLVISVTAAVTSSPRCKVLWYRHTYMSLGPMMCTYIYALFRSCDVYIHIYISMYIYIYTYLCIYIHSWSWNMNAGQTFWGFLLTHVAIHARYSQSHLGWHFRNLKAQSSNVSFATFQWKERFELWALSFETAFENVTPSGIGCNTHTTTSCNTPQYTTTHCALMEYLPDALVAQAHVACPQTLMHTHHCNTNTATHILQHLCYTVLQHFPLVHALDIWWHSSNSYMYCKTKLQSRCFLRILTWRPCCADASGLPAYTRAHTPLQHTYCNTHTATPILRHTATHCILLDAHVAQAHLACL